MTAQFVYGVASASQLGVVKLGVPAQVTKDGSNNLVAGSNVPLLNAANAFTNLLSVIPPAGTLNATITAGVGSSPAAISASTTGSLIASNATGGTDETGAVWEAQKFTAGSVTPGHMFTVSAKGSGLTATDTVTGFIYSDSAGSPGAAITTTTIAVFLGALTGSYQTIYCYTSGTALVNGTAYWLVLKRSSSTGTVNYDSRVDTGSSVVATSPDGVTWTLASGTKTLVYAVYGAPQTAVSAGSTSQAALYGNSLTGSGIVGTALTGTAGSFTSTHGASLIATSTYSASLQALNTQGIAVDARQNGTLLAANANAVLSARRTGAAGSFGYSAALIFGNDAPSSGSSTGALLRLQAASVDKWIVDNTGTLTTGIIKPSSLTGSGTVPLAGLSGITTSQLSATAGIVAAQIASVNPSVLTGSGTVPLAGLSGITTSQLSASAGIVAAQIASVTPTTLTGAGTIPLAALPAHGTNHDAPGSDRLYLFGGQEVTSAQENMNRLHGATTALSLVAGQEQYIYLTANNAQTITSVQLLCDTAASAATLVKVGLYTISGVALTLVFQSADVHATALIANNTLYTIAMTLDGTGSALANYTLVRGTRYAIGVICVGGTAAKLRGVGAPSSYIFNILPVLAKSSATGKTDIQTSETTPATTTLCPWAALS